MAMRITTKMMQSTSLRNLNTNKALQEKLTQQLATMKKITRPSDDPVIAIRALKLNSTLSKIDQYYEKNSEDAESWLDLTESAVKTTNSILEGMRTYIVQAAQGSLEASDRAAILENLSNFRREIYATGNADSAGRSIFTGYRTNTTLTFMEDKSEKYTITEQLNNTCLDTMTFVKTGDLSEINDGNFTTKTTNEYNVDDYDIARIRLAYSNVDYEATATPPANIGISYLTTADTTPKDDGTGTLTAGVSVNTTSYSVFVQQAAGAQDQVQVRIFDKDGTEVGIGGATGLAAVGAAGITLDDGTVLTFSGNELTITEGAVSGLSKTTTLGCTTQANADGTFTHTFEERYETTLNVTNYYDHNSDEAYLSVVGETNADNITYVAETGELLLGSNVQAALAELTVEEEIRITYDKTDWLSGDLDPVHYFYAERYKNGTDKEPLIYNEDKLTDPTAKQIIEYDIGSSQTIRVNTTADELYTHDIGRDIDEVITMLNEFVTLDDTYNDVKAMIDSEKYDGDELTQLETQLRALDKARTLAKAKVQDTCEGLQTTFSGYIEQATLARTNVGSRQSRLELIQNRLSAQQTNFQELVSDNEDADVTDLAIQLSSVELTYEAALSSISYVMKTTLLDFI